MTSGPISGDNDNLDLSGTPPTPTSYARMTAILEQLVRSHEAQVSMQAKRSEQMAKSHEAQLSMQAQIASILQVQSQLQTQMQTPLVPPVRQQHNVETQVVVQHKEKDPNVLYEQFKKRGAIEFYGTEDVMQVDV